MGPNFPRFTKIKSRFKKINDCSCFLFYKPLNMRHNVYNSCFQTLAKKIFTSKENLYTIKN